MRARINLPELWEQYQTHQRRNREVGGGLGPFNPEIVEPRPEWHGREIDYLGAGAFNFPGESLTQYHLIHPKHLELIHEQD